VHWTTPGPFGLLRAVLSPAIYGAPAFTVNKSLSLADGPAELVQSTVGRGRGFTPERTQKVSQQAQNSYEFLAS